ncbi:EGFR adapter protein-like [Uranotaenia lowii]|uniref:EGFR adapter protein-like n=1 Tax=Uranotaenia lowii TaxID=190385 RepID=UPI002478721B|nr:EGFR adapter protein-like [Uranotaenia lowii]
MQEVEYFSDILSSAGSHRPATRTETQKQQPRNQTATRVVHLARKCSYDDFGLDSQKHHQEHPPSALTSHNKCDENVNHAADPFRLLPGGTTTTTSTTSSSSSASSPFASSSSSANSSEEDNSPTEMNNCLKFAEKPTLIKRFALGFLRATEENLPLMCDHHKSSPTSPQKKLNDILSEDIYNLDRIVSSKFGDSCRQSLATGRPLPAAAVPSFRPDVEYEFRRNVLMRRQTNSANSSPKRFIPNIKRTDSLNSIEDNDLDSASWFQAGLPREISLEVLTEQAPGAFLVRRSTTKHGCFALSLRVPPPGPKVVHYLILRTERGYKIKGFTKEFSSLRALITHHSVMPEMLPVPLSLPRPQNIPIKCKRVDDYDSFSTLHEFSKLFSDLDL